MRRGSAACGHEREEALDLGQERDDRDDDKRPHAAVASRSYRATRTPVSTFVPSVSISIA